MFRKIAIVSTTLAMMMVLFVTAVPHHHHDAMICLAHEVCLADGCVDDEHTAHSDTDPEEGESHCVTHEKYCPSDELRLAQVYLLPTFFEALIPSTVAIPRPVPARQTLLPLHSPPLLTWRINC